jgi:hypothetical protein
VCNIVVPSLPRAVHFPTSPSPIPGSIGTASSTTPHPRSMASTTVQRHSHIVQRGREEGASFPPARRNKKRALRIPCLSLVAAACASPQLAFAAPFNVSTGLCNLFAFVPFTDR